MSNTAKPDRRIHQFQDLVDRLHNLQRTYQRLWIAFSGGLDSTTLLHAAARAFHKESLAVIHVNHHLSEHAQIWQSHCEGQVQALDIDLVVKDAHLTGNNIEASARQARMSIFGELAKDEDLVLTAHHEDDVTESLLWQFATGRAMVGIQEWLETDSCTLWRPFLAYSRSDLQNIAVQEQLDWVEDESNQDSRFTRNYLRHNIVPAMRERFPNFNSNIRQHQVEPLQRRQRSALSFSDASSEEAIREWLYGYGLLPSGNQIRELLRQSKTTSNVRVSLGSNKEIWSHNGELVLVVSTEEDDPKGITVGEDTSFRFGCVRWESKEKGLPRGCPLQVQQGCFDIEIVEAGETHSFKSFLRDQQTPPWEKQTWPVFFDNDTPVAVPGMAVADSHVVSNGLYPNWETMSVG